MVYRGSALLRLVFLAATLCFATVTQLFSQGFTSLNGVVTDPSGAIIPEATVSISNPQTGQQRQTKSDGSGRYSFQQVTPGRYKVTASATGFGDVVIESVELQVNTPSTLELNFQKIGTTVGTVTVEGDAAAVNTTDASLGNTIGTKPITQLPFEARNVVGLLSLQPGVTYLGEPEPGATSDYRSGTVNGGKADQGNVTLDGVDINDQQNRN